ncbi:MAG: ABC transporter permease [Aestuariivirga sp.]
MARRDLYRQASDQLLDKLKSSDPPAPQSDVEFETRLLAYTVRQIETDIRNGVDVFTEDYDPEELLEFEAKLAVIRERSKRRPPAAKPTEEQKRRLQAKISEHWQELSSIDRFSNLTAPSGIQRFFVTLFAVAEFNFANLRQDNRLYLLGELALPVFYVGIIMTIYYFLAMRFIYNMDFIQFAFTGAICWVMFRQTMLRVTLVLTRPVLLGFWQVGNLHRTLASAGLSFFIHSLSSVTMLLFGVFTGLFQFPHDPVMLTVAWLVIWVLGHNFGAIITGLTVGLKRTMFIKMVIIRLMQFIFGMYFVSEQFPEQIKQYILISPFVHVMQLFRGAYFSVYQSQDIDLAYLGWWLLASSVLALYFCGRVSRHVEAY